MIGERVAIGRDGRTFRDMVQVGVDFGGTKIEAAVLAPDGEFLARVRTSTPDNYDQSIRDVCALIERAEGQAGARGTIGVGPMSGWLG